MYKVIYFILPAFLLACGPEKKNAVSESDWKEMDSLMQHQAECWNQGDVAGFMKPYWKSDSLVFIGKKGLTYGWNETLANYQSSYPDREAMGRLRFTPLVRKSAGTDEAFMVGKWELFRNADTLSGHYSLLWKRLNDHWKIIADHSS